MEYSNDDLLQIYNCYISSGRRTEFAQLLYRIQFPDRPTPNREIFETVNRNLSETGTLRGTQPSNRQQRLNFCNWLVSQHRTYANFIQHILFTDEQEFKGDGIHHSYSINIWAGVMGNRLFGPFILPTRLNGQQYLDFLRDNLPVLLRDIQRQNMWFMHDGAPPHATDRVRELLNSDEYFPQRWIGRGGYIEWPSNSADLNPMDFYVWKTIAQYQHRIESSRRVHSLHEYQQQFSEAFQRFRDDDNNFETIGMMTDIRIQLCTQQQGGDFRSLIRLILR